MSGAAAAFMTGSGAPGVISSSLPNGSNAGSSDWTLANDGSGDTGDGAGGATLFNWVLPPSTVTATFYQVKVDVTAGSFTLGTVGSFLDLSTTRGWTKTVPGTVTFTVTIREKATGIVRTVQAGKTLIVS